ncbi:energy transducer TonB [Caulobacter sp. BP25]|uniref:energy transducer TonB n=1 Tax=Caulobacter sp. BP25 TaxID=2048900 RepID=UPI0013748339|nr:TonB family protein [Caulobacter sp. BP25]
MAASATPPTVTRSAAFADHAPVPPQVAAAPSRHAEIASPPPGGGTGVGRATAAPGTPTSAGAPPASTRAQGDYAARVRAWLEAHKTYPRKARQRREEGMAEIFLVLDRHGRVLRGELVRGSGYALLDAEVLAMLDRAAPFPPAPREIAGERLELSAVVDFHLDR